MIVVGLTGKAGCGKDTAADYLVKNHGFEKVSFATPLKNALKVMGLPEPEDRDDKEKLVEGFSFTWREAAQKLGTEYGRSLDEDFWVKSLLRTLEPNGKYVISDVRFENEAKLVREQGILIHITGRQAELGDNSRHASEAGVLMTLKDWQIQNVGSLYNLYERMDGLAQYVQDIYG